MAQEFERTEVKKKVKIQKNVETHLFLLLFLCFYVRCEFAGRPNFVSVLNS